MLEVLKQLFSKLPNNPVLAGDFEDYRANFDQAVNFTRACGISVKDLSWTDDKLSEDEGDKIEKAFRFAGVEDPSKSAFQCLKWCHYLAPFIEAEFKRPVQVTIGQLWREDQPVFNPSWKNLKLWSKSGLTFKRIHDEGRSGINLHAWLTVDTGEIVELSLLSSLAVISPEQFSEYSGGVAWGKPGEILEGHRYYPMAVGREFAEALDKNSDLALIAHTPIELHTYSYAFVPS
ncbi:hypothetical protein [Pseudomonas chlororaphis]|uniref:hypothetical protein n=1 Tax=Pseudomonas chlororaphis TaxID=587753 RepID=UPI001B305A51|nr:hypothetical protein [Pseudomonas chlororaphis]MBP5053739.1 hypothetical protein [Pseudomonas chlororaphis]MBP5142379.1 hypothetical protein [Pseudomonas chlororaphis]QTU00910.1 hypothetical protein HUT26_16985 [Pseudomonas chlororaphis]